MEKSCICDPICASNIDNYLDGSIIYTLDPKDIEDGRPSYWSSKGESSRDVSETLTYRLHKKLSVVHEVKMRMTIYGVHEVTTRPFQTNLQRGIPIYSTNAVRFRFGYSSSSPGIKSFVLYGYVPSDRSPCKDYV